MNTRIIKCPICGKLVDENWEIDSNGRGITQQYAWCTCGWGGSYPFQTKNPFTGKYAWEHSSEIRA